MTPPPANLPTPQREDEAFPAPPPTTSTVKYCCCRGPAYISRDGQPNVGAGFKILKDGRVNRSWTLPPWFQRAAWGQAICARESLYEGPETRGPERHSAKLWKWSLGRDLFSSACAVGLFINSQVAVGVWVDTWAPSSIPLFSVFICTPVPGRSFAITPQQ